MRWDLTNKYHSTRTEYGGRTYASQKEANYARTLDLRKAAGEIRSWRPQVPIPLEVGGERVCTYVVDFELVYPDGSMELVETKGFQTETWRLKKRLFEATWLKAHPEVRYTIR